MPTFIIVAVRKSDSRRMKPFRVEATYETEAVGIACAKNNVLVEQCIRVVPQPTPHPRHPAKWELGILIGGVSMGVMKILVLLLLAAINKTISSDAAFGILIWIVSELLMVGACVAGIVACLRFNRAVREKPDSRQAVREKTGDR